MLKLQGGGNAGNVAVALQRLNHNNSEAKVKVDMKLVSKIGCDVYGNQVIEEFKKENVNVSCILCDKDENTPFTYVIVDKSDNTRTCIHHPIKQQLSSNDFKEDWLTIDLTNNFINLLFLDSRHHEAALAAAEHAKKNKIPILLDIEKIRSFFSHFVFSFKSINTLHFYNNIRPGMDELLTYCTCLNTSSGFPCSYTKETNLISGIVALLQKHQQIQWCVTTLGKKGCILLEKCEENDLLDLTEIDSLDGFKNLATTSEFPVPVTAKSKGYRIFYCPAKKLSFPVVDTTGCGDAFIGGLLFGLSQHWDFPKILSFATTVAGTKTSQLGARKGLPLWSSLKLQYS